MNALAYWALEATTAKHRPLRHTITLACRYDDLKTTADNMELQTTILSRFDLIFIVKDERNAERDRQIAR